LHGLADLADGKLQIRHGNEKHKKPRRSTSCLRMAIRSEERHLAWSPSGRKLSQRKAPREEVNAGHDEGGIRSSRFTWCGIFRVLQALN